MVVYLCQECCRKKGLFFNGDAVNDIGRKSCYSCGTNVPSRLSIIEEAELKGIKKEEGGCG